MASRTRSTSALLSGVAAQFGDNKIFLFGLVLVLVGLGFKIAAFPFQIWAPDVYQGAPTPVTAFLAVGSKAAGFVLLLRVLFIAVPDITAHWANLLIIISGVSILYGNLCAIPQRNLKRLLGYSSIAHAGYLLLGVAALSDGGPVGRALLPQRLPVHGARRVHRDLPRAAARGRRRHQRPGRPAPALALAGGDDDPGDGLAGRHPAAGGVLREVPAAQGRHRARPRASRLLLPRLHRAGRRGDLALLLLRRRARDLLVRATPADLSPIEVSKPIRITLYGCIAGMLYLGLFPNALLEAATQAVKLLR